MPIVVLHRERSEKLASRFVEALNDQGADIGPWPDLDQETREVAVAAFDSLIQDGLIGEREPRPQGRE